MLKKKKKLRGVFLDIFFFLLKLRESGISVPWVCWSISGLMWDVS